MSVLNNLLQGAASIPDFDLGGVGLSTYLSYMMAVIKSPARPVNGNFSIVTWAGTNASTAVTGVGFQPDAVLIKRYDGVVDWAFYDSQRGVQNKWPINSSSAQSTDANGLTAFGVDGFTVGTSHSATGANYIAFCWKKGSAQFDVVKFTGDGSNGRLVNHSLGVTPGLAINKDVAGAYDTPVNVNGAVWAATSAKFISAAALNPSTYTTGTQSSTQFRVANTAYDNNSAAPNCLGICFGDLVGRSKISKYTGNGNAAGPTVTLGFRPRFIMITVNDTGGWFIVNSVRSPSNPVTTSLTLGSTAAESTTSVALDVTATGFQIKSATLLNTNAVDYLYLAIG